MKDQKIDMNLIEIKQVMLEAQKTIDFYRKLSGMTERVKCFN